MASATRTPARAKAKSLRVERVYTTAGVHPFDEVEWEKRDVVQTNWKTGEAVFEQRGVEFPAFWSENASTIVTTKYFRGTVGTAEREQSLRQVIDRVAGVYESAAVQYGYMKKADAAVFGAELRYMLLHQIFSFNSPVWFNVGTQSPQQVSACFLLAVDDSLESILNWYKEEGFIFKGGSGAGLNLSRIRSSKEHLSSGGTASGPISFMRGADASAGTIKSGGATRRAAKMVVLDVDHPDIEEFIDLKAREEDKIRALRDAGFDMDLGGKDISSVQYQNANNSVRVTDEFMRAVENGEAFGLRARKSGEVVEKVDARNLWRKIAEAAWACADPGVQYDDTINDWHTNMATGRITTSNPCSEYLSIDNSSCNLASINLMKFLREDDSFDEVGFEQAVEIIITAMEISISFGEFPTEKITANTKAFRQLGIGYSNLGALLMSSGLAYDGDDGRSMAASITALMTGAAYKRSAEIAAVMGSYDGYALNAEHHNRVMRKHAQATTELLEVTAGKGTVFVAPGIVTAHDEAARIAAAATKTWEKALELGDNTGYRNAQVSLLAPTGTISFMMDCDTTGVEPDFSLVKFKKLVGGGSMQIVNQSVPRALRKLGYNQAQAADIVAFITENGHVSGAPHLSVDHYPVFDCAAGQDRQIAPMGHLRMMAALQPSLSGAISKTVNLPESATVEEIEDIYYQSWKLGLKATAVYRDNCKVGQPLSDGKSDKKTETKVDVTEAPAAAGPARERLPKSRDSRTTSFRVGEAEGYMTVGRYPDGRPGEVFLKLGKQGSTLAGVMDAFSIAVSLGLQYGVPLDAYVSKMINLRFEPAGLSDDPDVRMPQSVMDYIFRRLALDHMDPEIRRDVFGIYNVKERTTALDGGSYDEPAQVRQDEIAEEPVRPVAAKPAVISADLAAVREKAAADNRQMCLTCGTAEGMVRTGACYNCTYCGNSTGCS